MRRKFLPRIRCLLYTAWHAMASGKVRVAAGFMGGHKFERSSFFSVELQIKIHTHTHNEQHVYCFHTALLELKWKKSEALPPP